MIIYKQGNIFGENVEALVNPVNCVGVMGAGLALQFKKRYPRNFSLYKQACNKGLLKPGKIFVYDTGFLLDNPKFIMNFPTKGHYKNPSKLEYIASGMASLIEEISRRKVSSVALPALGCGLGGLSWIEVQSVINEHFESLRNVDVRVLEPR